MSPRPRREIGTHGTITPTPQVRDDAGRWVTAPEGAAAERWRARVDVRDHDGRTRSVERYGPTKAKAKTALELALRDRLTPRDSDRLRPGMTFLAAGEVWLEQIARADAGLSTGTQDQYADHWKRVVKGSAFAHYTLTEANDVPRIRAFLQDVADERGSGTAKTTKTILSLILGMAVNDGVLSSNAVRLVKAAKRSTAATTEESERDRALLAAGWTLAEIQPDTSRAFTAEQRAAIIAKVIADEDASGTARRADAADLVAFMAGVGTRIEEALHVRWEGVMWPDSTVWIPGTKSETADRTLKIAPWLLDRLHARWVAEGRPATGYVFHAPLGGLEDARDRRNASRALRRVLDAAGHPWAVPHTFRRTVATLLDQAGVPLAQIADYLGHSDPAMTARVYLGRRMDSSLAASKL